MTRADADAMLREWGLRHGLPGAFNAHGLAAVTLGTTSLVLEWSAPKRAVIAHAVLYRFDAPASPTVREKLERAGLEYRADSRALCLPKTFENKVPADQLDLQLESLVASGLQWATEGIERLFA